MGREDGRHVHDLLEDRERLPEERLLSVHPLGALLTVLDLGGKPPERRHVLLPLVNLRVVCELLGLANVVVELLEEALLAHIELLLGPIALVLELLVGLGHFGLDL